MKVSNTICCEPEYWTLNHPVSSLPLSEHFVPINKLHLTHDHIQGSATYATNMYLPDLKTDCRYSASVSRDERDYVSRRE